MLGRLFGRHKGQRDEAVCATCGRTLLAGEWTQKVADEDGVERLLCSLCAQTRPGVGGERLKVGNGAAAAVRRDAGAAAPGEVLPASDAASRSAGRSENDALWKAIKDRDAQIERLKEQLARSEAERQELLAQLAQARATGLAAAAPEAAAGPSAPLATPARPVAGEAAGPTVAPAEADAVLDDTGKMPAAVGTGEVAAESALGGEPQAPEEAATEAREAGPVATPVEGTPATDVTGEARTGAETQAGAEAEVAGAAAPSEEDAAASTAEIAAPAPDAERAAAALTVLQRGVDLLNVSPVPRKIAETNADLGIPAVHVGYEDDVVAITFMWTMGWYRFTVAVDSGSVKLADRGYDERADLQPNASVRADGTVQLAAARLTAAAAQHQHTAPSATPPAAEPSAAERDGGTAAAPAPGRPEILSKSLLGQRTDDEQQSWEKTRARDFEWDR